MWTGLKRLRKLLAEDSARKQFEQEILALGEGLRVQFPIKVIRPEGLELAEAVKINQGVYLNCGGTKYGGDGQINLGKSVIISDQSVLYAGCSSIEIGDFSDIGVQVKILAHSRNPAFPDPGSSPADKHLNEPIVIGQHCWIGSGAIILGNTKLGDRCVVGAGAVVQGVYEEGTILMGNPARAIPGMK